MKLNKREFIALSAGSFAAVSLTGSLASAAAAEAEKLISDFTGGKKPVTGKISVRAPVIAENGNAVPVSVEVKSPMSADDYVTTIMLLADGNPHAGAATFHFSPMSGKAAAATRIRLAKTQNVIAIAKMSDGSLYMNKKKIQITISGC